MGSVQNNSSKHITIGKLQLRKELLALTVLLIIVAGAVALLSRAATTAYTYNKSTGAHTGRMFTADSPLNQTIPTDVRYLADGQTRLKAAGYPGIFSLQEWAIPIYDVDSSTPKAGVWCYLTDITAPWDTCHGINTAPVPMPAGVHGQKGGDGHVMIIDNSSRKQYDFWIWKDCQFVWNPIGAQWCPASGDVANIDGNGVGGGTTVSRLAGGVIRTYEIEQGVIDHALGFSTATTCKGTPYYPALYSDGTNTNQATCLPIGSRWQLDPSINVDALTNITPMEKIVAKALQKYGAYADDTAGTFGFRLEQDQTGRKVYQAAGAPDADYFPMKGIPWDRMKMIDPQWKSDGTKAYAWGGVPAPTTASVSVVPTPTTTTSSTPTTTVTPVPTTTLTPSITPTPSPSPTNGDTVAPSQPTNMRPTLLFDWVRGKYYINVAWQKSSDNVGVKDYLFTRNTTLLGAQTATFYQDYNVTANTIYNYEVRARDAAGNLSNPTKVSTTGRCFLFYCWLE